VSTKVFFNWGSVGADRAAAKGPDKVDEGIIVNCLAGCSDCTIGSVEGEGDETVSEALALFGREAAVGRASDGRLLGRWETMGG
jgi:hypothetical protein